MLDILSGIVVRNINKLLKRASPQGLAFFYSKQELEPIKNGSLSNSVDEEF